MAEKNIQMTQRNTANTGWDDLFPKTKAEQVVASDGTTVATHMADDVAHNRYGVATGTNTLVATPSPALTALKAGVSLRFKNTTANTGASTLNVNGLGAKPVVKNGGVALSSGTLKAGGVYTVAYDGTSFILQGEGGEYGNATAPQVLAPNTIGTENGVIPGTMPNRGAFNLPLGASVPAGYYSGGTAPNGKGYNYAPVSLPANATTYGYPGFEVGSAVMAWEYSSASRTAFANKGVYSYTLSTSPEFRLTISNTLIAMTNSYGFAAPNASWKAWEI